MTAVNSLERLNELAFDIQRLVDCGHLGGAEERSFAPHFQLVCKALTEQWRSFMFSDASESALIRYQWYHLDELGAFEAVISDNLRSLSNDLQLLISDQLFELYQQLLKLTAADPHPVIPVTDIYFHYILAEHQSSIQPVLDRLGGLPGQWPAVQCLGYYLGDLAQRARESLTYRDLQYYLRLLQGLLWILGRYERPGQDELDHFLESMNFNNLLYLNGRRLAMLRSLDALSHECREKWLYKETERLSLAKEPIFAFDSGWPSLKTLLLGCLEELNLL